MKVFDGFTNMYPVTKTLRFELVPQRGTKEAMEAEIAKDERRAQFYKEVKRILNDYHRNFINETLENWEISNLKEFYDAFLQKKGKIEKQVEDQIQKEIETQKEKMKKQITARFKESERWKTLFSKEVITNDLMNFVIEDSDKKYVEEFVRFTTYFSGFNENKENMYGDKKGSILHRLIEENLIDFAENIRSMGEVKKKIGKDEYEELNGICQKLLMTDIDDIFSIDYYSKCLTQNGITLYNSVLGGKTNEKGEKIQGINEYINLYNQKNTKKLPLFRMLYKQILSPIESLSFIDAMIINDEEVVDVITKIWNKIVEELTNKTNIEKLFLYVLDSDKEKLFLKYDVISDFSNKICGNWSFFIEAIEKDYDEKYLKGKSITDKYLEKKEKEIKKNKQYSFSYIEQCINKHFNQNIDIAKYIVDTVIGENGLFQGIFTTYSSISSLLQEENPIIKDNKNNVALIKTFLDSLKDLESFVRKVKIEDEIEKDSLFYSGISNIYKELCLINAPYNMVRNYVTKKPYSDEKVKMNFDCSTFLAGWDVSKEKDNLAVMLEKDNKYYLAVLRDKRVFDECNYVAGKTNYKKMYYKLIPGSNKQIPRIVFANSNKELFAPSKRILDIYERKTFMKGDKFVKEDLWELVDFYKHCLQVYPGWVDFNYEFSPTNTYESINNFYNEVDAQSYKTDFKEWSSDYIDSLVDDGKIYLFQLYNKDFSTYSTGKKNLYTLYWNAVFNQNNDINDIKYKLNGQAEMFYRKASILDNAKVVHYEGETKKNKNPRNDKEGLVFPHEITKDKRYTVDKFHFHVSITANPFSDNKLTLNDAVRNVLRKNEGVNIIGIDRGERNLVYYTIVNRKGEILKQESLNVINNMDYNNLLSERAKESEKAKRNWEEIGGIKNIKSGYLSLVVHELAKIMIENNAILVLENLNIGFVRGRQKIEKQIYQSFENALIKKLNYLVFKDCKANEVGGIYNALQLTNKTSSFGNNAIQEGFLFYVNAWNTSKIDPISGFVNFFKTKYVSVEKSKEFFSKFDSISFENDLFKFKFNYNQFNEKACGKLDWEIYSYGNRIKNYRDEKGFFRPEHYNLTQRLQRIFEKNNINYLLNLKEQIVSMNTKDFFVELLDVFSMIVKMRNSDGNQDYIISPVMCNGKFYDSRKTNEKYPKDADANGAYNIARKGLIILDRIDNSSAGDKIALNISNTEWLQYVQSNGKSNTDF